MYQIQPKKNRSISAIFSSVLPLHYTTIYHHPSSSTTPHLSPPISHSPYRSYTLYKLSRETLHARYQSLLERVENVLRLKFRNLIGGCLLVDSVCARDGGVVEGKKKGHSVEGENIKDSVFDNSLSCTDIRIQFI